MEFMGMRVVESPEIPDDRIVLRSKTQIGVCDLKARTWSVTTYQEEERKWP